MARFYGTVQGGRGRAARAGSARSGLEVRAQSWSGDVTVRLTAPLDADNSTDCVEISVGNHSSTARWILYVGPIRDLLEKEGQHAIVRKFAEQQLREEHNT